MKHNCTNFGGSDVCSQCMDDLRAENAKLRIALAKAEAAVDLREMCSDLDAQLRAANLQVSELQKERDGLTVVAELMWQSKTLLEAHQHFVAWRDKIGEFAEKQKCSCGTVPHYAYCEVALAQKRVQEHPKCLSGGEAGPDGGWIGGVWYHDFVPACRVCGVKLQG